MEQENKAQVALDYFTRGYSCAQSVFTAYHEEMGLDEALALKLSSSMGGGICGLREVCGAFTGLCMALGALKGYSTAGDQAAKERHYAMIQRLAAQFQEQYGTLICRDLLAQHGIEAKATPALRNSAYYRDRPCAAYVEACARMVEQELQA